MNDMSIFTKNNIHIDYDLNENVLFIGQINFLGTYCISPNGMYILGWDDKKESDNVVLIYKNNIILQGNVKNPNSASVSDIGNFVISSWSGNNGMSKFYAVTKTGYIQLNETILSNAGGTGISFDGSLAVCQSYESKNKSHSNMIFLYSPTKESLISSFTRICESSHNCHIDIDNKEIHLLFNNSYRSYSLLRYTFDGKFLDNKLNEIEFFNRATGYVLSTQAEIMLKEINSKILSDYDNILLYLNTAIERGVSDGSKAYIYRMFGEIYLNCNIKRKTIEYWNMAIAINPKIGLKNKVAQLEKYLV